jgi:hypothetical protein
VSDWLFRCLRNTTKYKVGISIIETKAAKSLLPMESTLKLSMKREPCFYHLSIEEVAYLLSWEKAILWLSVVNEPHSSGGLGGTDLDLDAGAWSDNGGKTGGCRGGLLFAGLWDHVGFTSFAGALDVAVADVTLEADCSLAAAATEGARRLAALLAFVGSWSRDTSVIVKFIGLNNLLGEGASTWGEHETGAKGWRLLS